MAGTGWRVTAFGGIAIPERVVAGRKIRVQAEDNVQLALDFGECCFASVTTGFTLQQYRGPGLELFGTQGTINLLGTIGIRTATSCGRTRPDAGSSLKKRIRTGPGPTGSGT